MYTIILDLKKTTTTIKTTSKLEDNYGPFKITPEIKKTIDTDGLYQQEGDNYDLIIIVKEGEWNRGE